MGTLKAVIFDIDGVIVDTENIHRMAYNRVFDRLKIAVRWSPSDYAGLLAQVGGQKIMTLLSHEPDPQTRKKKAEGIYVMKTAAYRQLISEWSLCGKLEPRPGVKRLIREIKDAGLAIGVASTCEKQGALALLRSALGENHYRMIDAMCAGDDVAEKKPAPDIYLLALSKLACAPENALAVEDSRHGLQAALAAGLHCIVTPSEYTKNDNFNGAALCIADLDGGSGPPVTVAVLKSILCASPSPSPV
jgi:beta-phosphoglucomutase-like phosphatase (HAD superfamily)